MVLDALTAATSGQAGAWPAALSSPTLGTDADMLAFLQAMVDAQVSADADDGATESPAPALDGGQAVPAGISPAPTAEPPRGVGAAPLATLHPHSSTLSTTTPSATAPLPPWQDGIDVRALLSPGVQRVVSGLSLESAPSSALALSPVPVDELHPDAEPADDEAVAAAFLVNAVFAAPLTKPEQAPEFRSPDAASLSATEATDTVVSERRVESFVPTDTLAPDAPALETTLRNTPPVANDLAFVPTSVAERPTTEVDRPIPSTTVGPADVPAARRLDSAQPEHNDPRADGNTIVAAQRPRPSEVRPAAEPLVPPDQPSAVAPLSSSGGTGQVPPHVRAFAHLLEARGALHVSAPDGPTPQLAVSDTLVFDQAAGVAANSVARDAQSGDSFALTTSVTPATEYSAGSRAEALPRAIDPIAIRAQLAAALLNPSVADARTMTGDGSSRDHAGDATPFLAPRPLTLAHAGGAASILALATPPVDLASGIGPAAPAEGSTPSLPNEGAVTASLVRTMHWQYRHGVGSAVVKLDPGYLGEVTVALQVERGVVTATLHAANADVRSWMQANEASLRQGLSDQGLALERLVVADDDAEEPSSRHPGREQSPDQEQQQRPRRAPRRDDAGVFHVVV